MHDDPVVIVLGKTLDLVAPTGRVRVLVVFVLVLLLELFLD
jgi:hypothetical protein